VSIRREGTDAQCRWRNPTAFTHSKENSVTHSTRSRFRRLSIAALGLTAAATLAACSGVQNGAAGGGGTEEGAEYPSGPVELIVGASAGGSTDLLARQIAASLETPLDETITVLNQPGANGAVAAGDLQNSAADGQRMMLTSGSLITITPLFVSEAEAISLDDIELVTGVGREDYVLVANADSGIETIDDIVNAGRNINYGTAGVGTGGQLSQALLFDQLEIDSTDVPFEGGAPTVTALLGNQIDVAAVQVLEAMPQIEAGEFVPIMTFGAERSPFLDVPTATEEGYDVVVDQSRFVWVPVGTPESTIDAIAEAYQAVFDDPEYQDFIEANYISADETDAETTAENLQRDFERYQEAATAAGLID
jgi:tripartite-type tricarboxylate transporter receptor subunit TctC